MGFNFFFLFDLEVKGQGPMKVIMVRSTPPNGHAPTYQIALTYLKRQKCYGPDKKILCMNLLIFRFCFRLFCFFSAKLVRTITFLDFQIGQLYLLCGCMTIRRCVEYRNDLRGTLTSRSDNFLNSIFLSEEEVEAEVKIRLKQYVSLCSKGRHN
jgi:hypothetical protein